MIAAEAKAMSIGQKFQIMEAIWEDLRERFESMPVSDEVKALLDERRERVARGESRLLDWDQVKSAVLIQSGVKPPHSKTPSLRAMPFWSAVA
jgi:hypothetical protein